MTRQIQIALCAFATLLAGCSQSTDNSLTRYAASSPNRPAFAADDDRPRAEPAEILEPSGELTLQTALALALLHNPKLKSEALEIRVADAERLQAALRPNPELEFVAEEIGAGPRSTRPGETTIAISQLIELAGKRQKRTRLGELQTRLAAVDYEARRLDVLTEVHARFVDLLAAQRRARIAEQLEHVAEQAADAVDTRIEAGKDAPLERARAHIRLSNARTQRAQARQDLLVARQALAALWAARNPRFETAVGDLETTTPIEPQHALIERIDNNPDVARWAVAIEQRRAAAQLEKAKAMPNLTIGGGVQMLDEAGETTGVFLAGIPLPLFDTNQGGRLAAAHRLAQANFDAHAARIRVETRLTEAHRDAVNALTRAEELRSRVLTNAQSLFESMDEGYRAGKFNYLDLLDAQDTLSKAQLDYVAALADYHKARAEMERLIGASVEQTSNADEK